METDDIGGRGKDSHHDQISCLSDSHPSAVIACGGGCGLHNLHPFSQENRRLFDRGLAVPVGRGFASARGQLPDDVPGVVAKIKAVMTAG